MKKLLFILCLFPLLIQAQDKEEAIMVLPDLLVKGEVVNGQQKDEKNRPIKAEGYLIAYFEVKPYVENPTHLKIN